MLPARRWPRWRASTKSARPRSGGLCGRAEPVEGAATASGGPAAGCVGAGPKPAPPPS
jgi:hypothetical protein